MNEQKMGRTRLVAVCLLILFLSALMMPGCGNREAAKQLELAKQSVTTSLDVWKRGEKAAALLAAPEPIEFFDDEWQRAGTLVDYQVQQVYMDPDGTPRCAVRLVIQHGSDAPEQLQLTYQIVTREKKTVIARDPFS